MATEHFDVAEVAAVEAELERLERCCSALADEIGATRHFAVQDRQALKWRYEALKSDLRELVKTGTVGGQRRPKNRPEQIWFDKPVRKALIALRPATNSHPATSRWAHHLWSAAGELRSALHGLRDQR